VETNINTFDIVYTIWCTWSMYPKNWSTSIVDNDTGHTSTDSRHWR